MMAILYNMIKLALDYIMAIIVEIKMQNDAHIIYCEKVQSRLHNHHHSWIQVEK
jgi:hypothetical protein